ncbi:DUF397 domain-containing protein [Streptomyces albidoflavus]|uniref:DUF397 domain-containing protein n=1 Tax=Streptomyces albidoflavus TaxID=1886 RepID=UPI002E372375|nr:DUF397 domain-containing protein [Streptomyces albidoflavus]
MTIGNTYGGITEDRPRGGQADPADSNTDSGSYVKVLSTFPSGVPDRDSKAPDGPAVVFPATSWSGFVTALRSDASPT